LSTEQRVRIVGCLVEGNSIRATVRMTGAAKNTVTNLLIDLGAACSPSAHHKIAALSNSSRTVLSLRCSFARARIPASRGRNPAVTSRANLGASG
jgi:hypothetical protein